MSGVTRDGSGRLGSRLSVSVGGATLAIASMVALWFSPLKASLHLMVEEWRAQRASCWDYGALGSDRPYALRFAMARRTQDLADEVVLGRGGVVLIGDSLTEWGDWPSVLPGRTVANLGVAGQTTGQMRARMCDVIAATPTHVFWLGGTNDLAQGIGADDILANTHAALGEVQRALPGVPVTIVSIPPTSWAHGRDIPSVNARLAVLAGEAGYGYLDLFDAFSTPSGDIRPGLSTDGLHFTPAAYSIWAARIEAVLDDG